MIINRCVVHKIVTGADALNKLLALQIRCSSIIVLQLFSYTFILSKKHFETLLLVILQLRFDLPHLCVSDRSLSLWVFTRVSCDTLAS
jgi:hypothetical protein